MQNRIPSGLSDPQRGQRMGTPSGMVVQAAGARRQEPQGTPLRSVYWMVCQYSRPSPVSSEKHETSAEAEVAGRAGDTSGVGTAMVVMGSYRPLPEPAEVMNRSAKAVKALRSRTRAKLYVEETLLERLAQHCEPVAAARRPRIHEEHTVARQRHLTRHRHLAAADQPHIRDGVVGGATRARGTHAVRAPVRPATRGRRMVSRASTRRIAKRRGGQARRQHWLLPLRWPQKNTF
jgi:hypothetical protein